MFLDWLIKFIKDNPQITMVTNRGLEDKCNHVIFVAKDLDIRYPELKQYLPGYVKKVEPIEEVVEESPKSVKKGKKK